MYQPPPGFQAVFQTEHPRSCREFRLVLESVGIRSEAVQYERQWFLIVPEADADRSAEELAAYHQESREQAEQLSSPRPSYGGAITGAALYAWTVMLVAILMGTRAFGIDWLSAGRMQAGLVMEGQWWRNFTALTLHLDIGHIASNLVFGIVFGLLAGRALGGGVAWLVIVLAGALGNLMNAFVQPPEHMSIGASTAVFSALGLLVSNALRPARGSRERLLKRWSPLIGGVLLLAFTGVGGERTDVTAHVTGFLAGMLLGWAGSCLPQSWLERWSFQIAAGGVALLLILVAWGFAIA